MLVGPMLLTKLIYLNNCWLNCLELFCVSIDFHLEPRPGHNFNLFYPLWQNSWKMHNTPISLWGTFCADQQMLACSHTRLSRLPRLKTACQTSAYREPKMCSRGKKTAFKILLTFVTKLISKNTVSERLCSIVCPLVYSIFLENANISTQSNTVFNQYLCF